MSRILVVEDDDSIRLITELALVSAGHEVRAAATGYEALEHLTRESADLILLDLRMPLMDGTEFAREYRERAGAAPIVVLTAATERAVSRKELSASRYLEKPFDLDELLRVVDEVAGGGAD